MKPVVPMEMALLCHPLGACRGDASAGKPVFRMRPAMTGIELR
jgi:hypothetical protein